MDTIDRDILKYMSKRDRYNELKDVITKSLCVKESWELLTDFGVYFDEHPNVNEIDNDFIMWQRVKRHPNWKPDEARIKGHIVTSVLGAGIPDRPAFLDSINHIRTAQFYKGLSDDVSSGTLSAADAHVKARAFGTNTSVTPDNGLVTMTLNDLSQLARQDGFYWRLEDLNKSIGPIRKGDSIVVAKRPEVGGTSFLVSELSHMLEQTNGNAIIFNNEETPDKLFSRFISASLGVDYRSLLGDPFKYDAAYKQWLDGKSWDLVHDTSMTISSIHRQLESKKYDLIGINVLLKVGGTGKKEDHDKFQELGEECRRIAQEYGPVIAVVQADPEAEGVEYIAQDKIYKSKTALQGEADALIMIGTGDPTAPGADKKRFIHVAKNKIPPAPCTETSMKHIRSEVKFDMDTGRFTSKNFGTYNSRSKK